MIFRIFTLCSDKDDQKVRTLDFFRQLQRRGYQPNKLRPYFKAAILRAQAYTGPSDNDEPKKKKNKLRHALLFHLQYHPNNPPSKDIQRTWKNNISAPLYSKPLAEIKNHNRVPIGIDRMIIAYSRPPNLGNILSYRKLDDTNGPPVSQYAARYM